MIIVCGFLFVGFSNCNEWDDCDLMSASAL